MRSPKRCTRGQHQPALQRDKPQGISAMGGVQPRDGAQEGRAGLREANRLELLF